MVKRMVDMVRELCVILGHFRSGRGFWCIYTFSIGDELCTRVEGTKKCWCHRWFYVEIDIS